MKILVIQQKMIGDVLTSSILFKALRNKFPDAELHYMIFPHTEPVIRNNPYIDRIIYYQPDKLKNPFSFAAFVNSIRKQKYKVIIDVYSKIGTGIISLFSGAEIRAGYKKWYTNNSYTHSFKYAINPETRAGLAVENRMLLLSAISADFPEEIKPEIYLTQEEKKNAELQMRQGGIDFEKPRFMIGILGSSPNKTYPLRYMAKFLDHLAITTNAQFLFNYIPSQKKEMQRLLELCTADTRSKIFEEVYGKSLREFIAMTSQCDALIGNEGGAVNMAKAVNTPTFSIFAPQIDKNAWSLYEDEVNMAVHLKDFQPEIFENNTEIKDNVQELYQDFKSDMIIPELDRFIKNLSLDSKYKK
ncbi:glycosyltransferase family 9 protein [Christiangramia salexigens]|uniref:Glycosyltransferase n=1 Tax=Christiangramia salexigens TaxID=1913577 RepID=A0A1L3J4F3_9FLAO|nr:glycosyltransferase family 9 protein [Christiangramia salexigens]APG59983.1 glycosyltransferase [Christiangramia salexigens]